MCDTKRGHIGPCHIFMWGCGNKPLVPSHCAQYGALCMALTPAFNGWCTLSHIFWGGLLLLQHTYIVEAMSGHPLVSTVQIAAKFRQPKLFRKSIYSDCLKTPWIVGPFVWSWGGKGRVDILYVLHPCSYQSRRPIKLFLTAYEVRVTFVSKMENEE